MDTTRLDKSASIGDASATRIMTDRLSFEDPFRVLALIDASPHFGKIALALLAIFSDSPQLSEPAEITLFAQHPFSSR